MRNSIGGLLTEVRWGIIGCGDVCAVKSGPAFGKVEGSCLQAVCRRTRSKAYEYAQEHNVPAYYSSAADLLQDDMVNAIYIATQPDSHVELALQAAAVGRPTLLEKPMARNSIEAAVIAAAFERKSVPLFVAYYRRALPRYIRAKELLSRIGPVRSVSVDVRQPEKNAGWRTVRIAAGGGLFVDVGSHVVDILDWMLGPVVVLASHFGSKDVSSWMESPPQDYSGVEDHVFFAFSLPLVQSAEVNLACFDFAHNLEPVDRISICGWNGLTLSFPALGLYRSDPAIRIHDAAGHCILEDVVDNPAHVHQPLIESIVRELRGHGEVCPSTARSGLRAALAVDAALEWGRRRNLLRQQGFMCDALRQRSEASVIDALAASGRTVDFHGDHVCKLL
jgi:1,5-anhydro-D-fructose reductase (1,5-anhydro-D-mannitol-forming)